MHALSLVIVGLLNLGLAALIYRTRTKQDVKPLMAFLVGITCWTLPQGLLLVETNPQVGLLLSIVINSGAVIMATGLFHFALAYTGRDDWLRPGRLGLVYLGTATWIVVIWTDPLHHWMHQPMTYTEVLLPVVEYQNVGYWLYVFWNWSLSAGGIYLFFLEYLDARGSGVYHRQARLVVLAPLIPGVANVLAFNGTTAINYSVWGFGATGILIAVALYRYQWLDLVPIGRDSVIEEMRDGYLVVDDQHRVVDLNPAARSLLTAPDPLGKAIDEVLPECEPLLTGETRELTITRGEAIVDATSSTIDDGEILGAVLMLRDVTDQRRAEKRFQVLIENGSDVITLVDESGVITYASPSIETVLGYRPTALVGTSLLELVHPDDRRDAVERFTALPEPVDGQARFEYRVRHRDGSWVILEGVAVDLLENEIVGGVVINSRDVTERNERERELERTNQRLDEFAGVLSHDLRNPLGLAQTYATFAEESGRPEDLQVVHDAHDRMERMVTNLLTMARAGGTLEETEPVSVRALSEDAWETVRADGATLTCDLPAEWTVEGDPERLLHVFENLFRNALEHGVGEETPVDARDGGGSEPNETALTVRVGALERAGARGFFVEDDGVGIPPERRETVFERGRTTSAEGTGFGLSIARDVVDAHGWRIGATESASGGARFEIEVE
ncbi:hypothetical protein GCM10025298_30900 [Natronobiforma cellulositropha]